MTDDDDVLSPPEIRQRLSVGAAAAVNDDSEVLDDVWSWLTSVPARELLRIDGVARQFYGGSLLGQPQNWTTDVLSGPPVVAVLASMHPDGYVRERGLRALIAADDPLSDRAVAMRVSDHVTVIRETAAREVLQRTALEQAGRIMPVLHRIVRRSRGADVLQLYRHTLVTEYGESRVWARLRQSSDHDLRRVAFRYNVDNAVLGLDDVIRVLPRERDPIVRRLLAQVVADTASTEVVASVLLHARSAEVRARGLVRLAASDLEEYDVERLLVDSSAQVRLWACRRWQEMGNDPVSTYLRITRSVATPTVRARAYLGLTEMGTVIDRDEALELIRADDLPLQKVGLRFLAGKATAEDIPQLLALVTGENSTLAHLAGDVLATNPALWTVDDLAGMKTSGAPTIRRRAWRIHRNRRGWEAVIADLEILHDDCPQLAALGRQPAAPMYFQPDERQQRRIADLLLNTSLNRDQKLSIAYAAGLRDLAATIRNEGRGRCNMHDAENARPWWQRIWKRA